MNSPTNELTNDLPPLARAVGMELISLANGECIVEVPYAKHLVGDPDTGVIHGGVITTALDNASGWAIRAHTDWADGLSMATLDIRIDYMRPAEPEQTLIVCANCYKITKNVAFVRACAHQGDADDPVATSVAAFMLGTANKAGQNL